MAENSEDPNSNINANNSACGSSLKTIRNLKSR